MNREELFKNKIKRFQEVSSAYFNNGGKIPHEFLYGLYDLTEEAQSLKEIKASRAFTGIS